MASDFVKITTDRTDVPDTLETVIQGLQRTPKKLPSFLFYDEEGDRLFREIMQLPGYYLTRCEQEILQEQSPLIVENFTLDDTPFDLVELGAGDGTKTELLLRELLNENTAFRYVPVDVSKHVLHLLAERLRQNLPSLTVLPMHGRIEHMHDVLDETTRKVFLYLGANIGNFTFTEAQTFLRSISEIMHPRDLLLIGFDLRKDPRLILSAYDDSTGVTARFNLNLLERLNRDFGANFDPAQFQHFPTYDPETGTTRSFLVSRTDQTVRFRDAGVEISFKAWETIHTEVSVKYDFHDIRRLAEGSNLDVIDTFTDSKQWFADVLFMRS
jgi:probable methyltransferase